MSPYLTFVSVLFLVNLYSFLFFNHLSLITTYHLSLLTLPWLLFSIPPSSLLPSLLIPLEMRTMTLLTWNLYFRSLCTCSRKSCTLGNLVEQNGDENYKCLSLCPLNSYDWLASSFKITSDFELEFGLLKVVKSNAKKGKKKLQNCIFFPLWEGHYTLWRCFSNKIRFCHCLLFPSAFHLFSLNRWSLSWDTR